MTSERDLEMAREWLDGLHEFFDRMTGGMVTEPEGYIEETGLAALLARAREEQREADARIADNYASAAHLKGMHTQYDTARFLAAALRGQA